jgi:hypothetical protein
MESFIQQMRLMLNRYDRLHIVDQIKLNTTIPSFINEGTQDPMNTIMNDTTFKGNKQ